jgi:hypothetical protein
MKQFRSQIGDLTHFPNKFDLKNIPESDIFSNFRIDKDIH